MGVSSPSYRVIDGSLTTGGGDVTGAASSTDTAIALWNGTSGTDLKNSVVLVSAAGNVTGMGTLGCGAITSSGSVSGTSLIPTGSTVPANGIYLPSANTLAFAANTTLYGSISSAGLWTLGASGGTEVHVLNGTLSASVKYLAGDGTAALPAYSFSSAGSSDNGMYLKAANSIGWSTSGTEAGFISSAGAWTLGVSSGSETHTVRGSELTLDTAGATPFLLSSAQATGGLTISGDPVVNTGANIIVYGSTHATLADNILFREDATTIGSYDGTKWTFGESASTATHLINGRLDLTGPSSNDARIVNQATGTGNNSIIYCNVASSSTAAAYNVFQESGGGTKFSIGLNKPDDLFKIASADGFGSNVFATLSTAGKWVLGASGGTQVHDINGFVTTTGYVQIGSQADPGAPTNSIRLGSIDTAGESTATLALRTEQAVEAIGVFVGSHKLKVNINGVEYWLELDAV